MCKKTNYKSSNTRIDKCMRSLIKWIRSQGYETVASCCGHGKYPLTVVIKEPVHGPSGFSQYFELSTSTEILRTRNFYKKDKQGYYYIPEVDGVFR